MTNEDILKELDLLDCPRCHGPALLEEESSSYYYITCMDCGCHTAEVEFNSDSERLEAAKKAANRWNCGKTLSSDPGE